MKSPINYNAQHAVNMKSHCMLGAAPTHYDVAGTIIGLGVNITNNNVEEIVFTGDTTPEHVQSILTQNMKLSEEAAGLIVQTKNLDRRFCPPILCVHVPLLVRDYCNQHFRVTNFYQKIMQGHSQCGALLSSSVQCELEKFIQSGAPKDICSHYTPRWQYDINDTEIYMDHIPSSLVEGLPKGYVKNRWIDDLHAHPHSR